MRGLFGLIHESTHRYPERVFIRHAEREWTYSQVYSMSLNVSRYLLERGVNKGERVIIFCENSIQYIAAFFGTLGMNAVAVPVNPAKMIESLLYIVEKCSPRLILAGNATIDKLERVKEKLCIEIVNLDRCIQWEQQERADHAANGADASAEETDAAIILFTSGTTAQPKGVTLTHGNLLANTKAIIEYLHVTGEDSVLMTLPFTYSYGNSILLTHAYAGASIVIENSTTYPFKVLEAIKKHRVSGFSTVGSYINLMLKCIKNSVTEENFFENLRYITFAGESTSNDDVLYLNKNYPHIKVYVMYGQTEACARLSYLSPEMLPEKIGSVGKGLSNVILRVVDDTGSPVKPGETGELTASGPSIMKGYWEDPAATEEVLREGWLYTGDYATVDVDGFIYIKGRKSDMIKYMGHRISPVEIETVINSCRYVKESAVVEGMVEALPVIKAFVVLEQPYPLEEVRKYVHARLPNYMRPQVFETVEQLPRTESGKIRRSALRRNI